LPFDPVFISAETAGSIEIVPSLAIVTPLDPPFTIPSTALVPKGTFAIPF